MLGVGVLGVGRGTDTPTTVPHPTPCQKITVNDKALVKGPTWPGNNSKR